VVRGIRLVCEVSEGRRGITKGRSTSGFKRTVWEGEERGKWPVAVVVIVFVFAGEEGS